MAETDHTFAVCAYKESPYLEDLILSLKNQTVKSTIVIATGTPNEYIQSIAKKYDVSFYVNPNSDAATLAGDWTFALSCADTKFVTLAHQDDFYEPTYTEKVLESAKVRNPIIIFTEYYELRNGEKVYNSKLLKIKRFMNFGFRIFPKSKFIRNRILSVGNPICCPAVTYSREYCNNFKFSPDYQCCCDWEAWSRLSSCKGDFVYINKALMAHRVHEQSTTTETIANGIRYDEEFRILRKYWPEWVAKIVIKYYSRAADCNKS